METDREKSKISVSKFMQEQKINSHTQLEQTFSGQDLFQRLEKWEEGMSYFDVEAIAGNPADVSREENSRQWTYRKAGKEEKITAFLRFRDDKLESLHFMKKP